MKNITVNLEENYNIYIDYKIDIKKYIQEIYSNKKIYLISDESLYIHEQSLLKQLTDYEVKVIKIKSSEENKTLTTYEYIVKELLNYNITRDSLIISLGGGVVGDIAGFVSSTILRGIKYVSIPTTLLSQVDSSIGGKTALNINNKKNIIGTFYQPSLVLIDTSFLETLSNEEYDNGLGEIVKSGLIRDKEILSLLQGNFDINDIIYKCLLVKKYYVEKDQFDKADRMILNFGHTFGHVIELQENIKHGIAVLEGIFMALEYGIDLKITNENLLNDFTETLNKLKIKIKKYNYKEYLDKLNNDKKNNEDNISFIFLEEINKPIIKQIKR